MYSLKKESHLHVFRLISPRAHTDPPHVNFVRLAESGKKVQLLPRKNRRILIEKDLAAEQRPGAHRGSLPQPRNCGGPTDWELSWVRICWKIRARPNNGLQRILANELDSREKVVFRGCTCQTSLLGLFRQRERNLLRFRVLYTVALSRVVFLSSVPFTSEIICFFICVFLLKKLIFIRLIID